MTVRVLLFAVAAEAAGERAVELDLPDNTAAGAALESILRQFPDLEPLRDRLALAVNLEYVGTDYVLRDGDELAVIPPVSGG